MANMFQAILDRFRGDTRNGQETQLGYDVLTPKGRRKAISSNIGREDRELQGNRRDQLQATAKDLARNQALASWMIRRHLDYVAMFKFHPTTGSKGLDEDLAGLMEEQARPNNADVAGRFTREKLFRLAETLAVIGGDNLWVKLDNLQIQGIQADLIRNPPRVEPRAANRSTRWIQGVKINGQGRPLAFGVYNRTDLTNREYSKTVQARNALFYGFFEAYASDQTRGVSPMVTALAPLQDVYEGFNFALAKMKVSQLLAIAFYRENVEPLGDMATVYTGQGTDRTDVAKPKEYRVSFGGGPKVFNLDPGDRAEFLESKNPSAEFQNFSELVIGVALKSLDIPYSFYDESHTNFFGSRAAWLHYDRSCKDKRDNQLELRRRYTLWQLAGLIRDGRLVLPRTMSLADLGFEWIPLGMPWWDPTDEIKGHESAMANALDNPQRICKSAGTTFEENVDKIAAAKAYAESKGVDLKFATNQAPAPASSPQTPPDESDEEDDDRALAKGRPPRPTKWDDQIEE